MKLPSNTHIFAKWRSCYSLAYNELKKTEDEKPALLRKTISTALSDKPRSGAHPRITPEQVAVIIALSCEEPMKLGLPFSHWSPPSLPPSFVKAL